MKRAFVFLVAAPVTVFFTVLLIWVAATGADSFDFGCLVAGVLSILALPVSAISWTADEFLGRALPVSLRMCLTALIAATATAAEVLAVFNTLFPPSIMMTLAICGAMVMAMGSLLSNDHNGRQQLCLEPAGA